MLDEFGDITSINDTCILLFISVSLAQLIRTIHHICNVWSSNPGHYKNKIHVFLKFTQSCVIITCYVESYYFSWINKKELSLFSSLKLSELYIIVWYRKILCPHNKWRVTSVRRVSSPSPITKRNNNTNFLVKIFQDPQITEELQDFFYRLEVDDMTFSPYEDHC